MFTINNYLQICSENCHDNLEDYNGLLTTQYQCVSSYNGGKEKQPYGPEYMHNDSLAILLFTSTRSKQAWAYTSAGKDGNFPIIGETGTYSGDGYSTELIVDLDISNATVVELKENLWIDRQTRAIFLEFILYNADSNLFSFVTLWLEIPITGGPLLKTDATMIRIYGTGFNAIYMRVMEVLFVTLLVTNIGIFIYQVKCEESFIHCIKKPRIVVDLCLFITSFLLVIIFAVRYFTTKGLVSDVKGDVVHFIPFQRAVFFHNIFTYFLGFVTCLAFLKLVILLRLMERIAKLAATLRYSALDLLSTLFLISIGVFAFGMLGYLAFHTDTKAYRTFVDSLEMLIGLSMGEFRGISNQFSEAKPLLRFYVITYMLFTQIFMFNILIAVIIDSHNMFKSKSVLHPKDHELVGVIFGQVRNAMQKALDKYTQLDGAGYM